MKPNQPAPKKKAKSLLDIPAEDLAKVERARASTEGHVKVDNEWLLLTEFTLKFGWDAYRAVKNDEIMLDEVLTLIEASRRIDNFNHYRNAQASFIGAGSSRAKKPSSTFKQLTSKIIKSMKADV